MWSDFFDFCISRIDIEVLGKGLRSTELEMYSERLIRTLVTPLALFAESYFLIFSRYMAGMVCYCFFINDDMLMF